MTAFHSIQIIHIHARDAISELRSIQSWPSNQLNQPVCISFWGNRKSYPDSKITTTLFFHTPAVSLFSSPLFLVFWRAFFFSPQHFCHHSMVGYRSSREVCKFMDLCGQFVSVSYTHGTNVTERKNCTKCSLLENGSLGTHRKLCFVVGTH